MKSNMTRAQWNRLSALTKLVNHECRDLITSYRGDLVYDGALLAESTGPIVMCLRDCGTHIHDTAEDVATTLKVFGEGERSRYFYGEATGEEFAFRPVTAADAICLLKAHEEEK